MSEFSQNFQEKTKFLQDLYFKYERYFPLFVIVAVSFVGGFAIAAGKTFLGPSPIMTNSMGLFLVIFSSLKIFDLPSFANGFQKYDLLAMRDRRYALAYPFIELSLGLLFLADTALKFTSFLTMLVMLVGTAGVVSALRKGLNVECACMGTVLKVPLSTVTLSEDLIMAAMAAMVAFG